MNLWLLKYIEGLQVLLVQSSWTDWWADAIAEYRLFGHQRGSLCWNDAKCLREGSGGWWLYCWRKGDVYVK